MSFSLYIFPSFYFMREESHYSMYRYMKTLDNVWYYCKKFSMELQAHFQMIFLTFILCSLSLSLSLKLFWLPRCLVADLRDGYVAKLGYWMADSGVGQPRLIKGDWSRLLNSYLSNLKVTLDSLKKSKVINRV